MLYLFSSEQSSGNEAGTSYDSFLTWQREIANYTTPKPLSESYFRVTKREDLWNEMVKAGAHLLDVFQIITSLDFYPTGEDRTDFPWRIPTMCFGSPSLV